MLEWLFSVKNTKWHLCRVFTWQRAFVLGGRLADRPAPAADAGDAARREDGACLVLPCSRSCWSYHGSSSSVTNSSIFPELSMGDPGRNRRNEPLCENKRAPARQQVAPSSWSPQPGSVVLWLSTCFLFPSSLICAPSVTPTSSSHPPTAQQRPVPVLRAAAPPAATEERTDVAEVLQWQHFLYQCYQQHHEQHAHGAFRYRS